MTFKPKRVLIFITVYLCSCIKANIATYCNNQLDATRAKALHILKTFSLSENILGTYVSKLYATSFTIFTILNLLYASV